LHLWSLSEYQQSTIFSDEPFDGDGTLSNFFRIGKAIRLHALVGSWLGQATKKPAELAGLLTNGSRSDFATVQ
jgi:hypothetical protein